MLTFVPKTCNRGKIQHNIQSSIALNFLGVSPRCHEVHAPLKGWALSFAMLNFLKQSKNFCFVTFKGYFDMNTSHLEAMYGHYLSTGENLLDNYCNIEQASWMENEYMTREQANKVISDTRIALMKSLYSEDKLMEVRYVAGMAMRKYERHLIWLDGKRRRNASKYISKKDVREWVFSTYGKKCLCCGSKKKISIDHVIPVVKGGEDELWNLQPLCNSCNSKKSDKAIDYRNNIKF